MNWILLVVSIVTCVIGTLLGLTAGINLNPASTLRFVPNWGSVGDWVSGIGALLAVAVALWQVHRQQEREKPKILMHQHYDNFEWVLGVVSDGHVPVTILGAHIEYDESNTLDLADHLAAGHTFPKRLDRGEVMNFLSLNRFGTSLLGKAFIRPRLEHLEEQGLKPVIYLKATNDEYFACLNSIRDVRARLVVRTPQTTEEFEVPADVFAAILQLALDDVLDQAKEILAAQRRDAKELLSMFEAHRQVELGSPDAPA